MLLDPREADRQHEAELVYREGYDPWVHRMIIQSLTDDQIVVDAGCGNMKLDDPCIIRMDTQLTQFCDVVADLHALPFKASSIDFIFSLAVFEHLRQPFKAADEIFTALKPGGYAYAECNFVFSYHGYPHHYFNASVHGMQQIFSRFKELRLGVAPYQTPSFALENVLLNYLEFFKAESAAELRFVNLIRHLLQYPIRHYDSKINSQMLYRIAAGVYFLGIKQPNGDETRIPQVLWDIYERTPELQKRFPGPNNLALPDNLMFWAKNEGRRLFPEIAEYLANLKPFSKYTNPAHLFDRSAINCLPPIADPDSQHIAEQDYARLEETAAQSMRKFAMDHAITVTNRDSHLWARVREIYQTQGVLVLIRRATSFFSRKFTRWIANGFSMRLRF